MSWDRLKSSICPINRPLLKLKSAYFLIFSLWIAVFTYVSLISTQIISYNQLAVIHACVPFSSILGPVFVGFVADKVGNYKLILMGLTLVGGLVYLPVLWLQAQHERDEKLDYIFPILLIIRLFGFLVFDASVALLDSCGMCMSKMHGGDFGRQKMWGMASLIVIPFVCGILVDYISAYRGFKDYSSAFYVATALSLMALPLISQLDVQVRKNEQSVIRTARTIVGMIDVNAFLLVQVVVGFCWAYQRSFFIVFTDTELEASKTLFGASLAVGGTSSMIMYSVAKFVIGHIGAPSAVAISLLFTCLRFSVYYLLTNPWIILVNELLDGVSGFLGIVAGNYFSAEAAPDGMLASMNGVLTAAVYGAGRGLGLTVGSLLISSCGIRLSYLILAILAGTTSVLYMTLYHLWLKKMEIERFAAMKSNQNESGVQNADIELKDTEMRTEPTELVD